jgi:hypothetical protein
MGECSSLERLADYLEAELPSEDADGAASHASAAPAAATMVQEPSPATVAVRAPSAATDADVTVRLLEQQVRLLTEQVAMLAAGATGQAAQHDAAPTVARNDAPAGASIASSDAPARMGQGMDARHPVVDGARLGREPDGRPAWFVPDQARAGKFLKVGT